MSDAASNEPLYSAAAGAREIAGQHFRWRFEASGEDDGIKFYLGQSPGQCWDFSAYVTGTFTDGLAAVTYRPY